MKPISTLVISIVIICLSTSCTSPLRIRLLTENKPTFNGIITPITIPIYPELRPLRGTRTTSYAIDCSLIVRRSNLSTYSLFEDESTINEIIETKKLGDMLTHNSKVYEISSGAQVYKTNIPFVDMTLLTDKYGFIRDSEIVTPYYDQLAIRSSFNEKQRKAWDNLKKLFPEIISLMLKPFFKTEITTGSVIASSPLKQNVKILMFVTGLQYKDVISQLPETVDDKVEGWSYYKGRKILVVSEDYSYEGLSAAEGVTCTILFSGYRLIDPETFSNVQQISFHKITFSGVTGLPLMNLWQRLGNNMLPEYIKSGDIVLRSFSVESSTIDK